MKMYLISDNIDTQTGMRLAGVDGVVVHEREELRTALETALADKELGILLLTEKFGREFPEIVDERFTANMESLLDGDPRPSRYRPETGFYHLLCQRSHWTKTVTINQRG